MMVVVIVSKTGAAAIYVMNCPQSRYLTDVSEVLRLLLRKIDPGTHQ
jgi:hypothetical protein